MKMVAEKMILPVSYRMDVRLERVLPRFVRVTKAERQRQTVIGFVLPLALCLCYAFLLKGLGENLALWGIGIIFVVVAGWWLFNTSVTLKQNSLLRNGFPTIGVVSICELATNELFYAYQVEGKRYTATVSVPSNISEMTVARYPVGTIFTILYDAKDPGRSYPFELIDRVELLL